MLMLLAPCRRKSFVVYAQSPREKASWIQVMNKFIALARESVGLDPQTRDAEARALWVPDSKVNQCMVSGCGLKFSLVNRKHHCRNCGKVVCGPCSASKAILNQTKPERVCKVCHEKLGGVNPTDIPVLGKLPPARTFQCSFEMTNFRMDLVPKQARRALKRSSARKILRMIPTTTTMMKSFHAGVQRLSDQKQTKKSRHHALHRLTCILIASDFTGAPLDGSYAISEGGEDLDARCSCSHRRIRFHF